MGDTLARLVAHMMILGHHQQQLSPIGPEHMAQAAAKGDFDSVKEFIKLKKELVRIFPFTFTSLRKFYSRHHDLFNPHAILVSQMTTDILR